MQIKFGEKGSVIQEVLLDDKEETYHPQHSHPTCCRSKPEYGWCGRSWLTLVVVLAVVVASQSWFILYQVKSWSTNYTPAGHFMYKDQQGQVRHVRFSWSNCGSKLDPAKLVELQVNPDPLSLSHNITLNLVSYLGLSVDAPLSAKVKVQRHVGIWWPVPCIDGYGSCHYKDICQLTPFPEPNKCPDPFPRFKLPCRCPINKGPYIVNKGTFNVTSIVSSLPTWLVSGDYYAKVIAYRKDTKLGCYEFYVSIST
ncbi:hypothetical protein Pmani_011571 [Petrolisthes manimaculis]|uniref:MD-2-related lipid-recognition domain-containing protein n=1 Tax=Petrolisthes manimaculis TaxID=1843537 RepID=A0AAE1Q2M8_9EUCA|nr:hypothetical protein Pmani_011571 [Petrolisthes manimaculis]